MSWNPPSRSSRSSGAASSSDLDAHDLLAWAIGHELCVRVRRGRSHLILGPHIVYRHGGTWFVDAVVIERDGVAGTPGELIRFKVAALRDVVSTIEAIPRVVEFGINRYAEADHIHAVLGGEARDDQAEPATAG